MYGCKHCQRKTGTDCNALFFFFQIHIFPDHVYVTRSGKFAKTHQRSYHCCHFALQCSTTYLDTIRTLSEYPKKKKNLMRRPKDFWRSQALLMLTLVDALGLREGVQKNGFI